MSLKGKFVSLAKRFAKEETGATMVEYGVVVALIAIVCITALTTVGTNLSTGFSAIATKITSTVKAP